jgi:hypothetical protein
MQHHIHHIFSCWIHATGSKPMLLFNYSGFFGKTHLVASGECTELLSADIITRLKSIIDFANDDELLTNL